MTLSTRQLMLACAGMYLVLVALLFQGIWRSTGGHFTYALDDPYIHLALAENLAHGDYGINPGEPTSPSSSLLWPYLLIPFAGTPFHVYMPLLWCVLFGTLASALIGLIISQWQADSNGNFKLVWYWQLLTGLLLILVANLASLTIVGMEHVLQILLAICCAFAVLEALAERRIAGWCLVAAAFAPAVRYEDVSLTLAVCFALVAQKRWKAAVATMSVSLAPLALFSLFLKSKGLPLLPLSVLVKADAYVIYSGPLEHLHQLIRYSIKNSLSLERFPITVLCMIAILFALRARTWSSRITLMGVCTLGILQGVVGRFNWFHRYEVYALIFMVLVVFGWSIKTIRIPYLFRVAGIFPFALTYVYATLVTVTCATKIYRQQYQMHRFVTEVYRGNYAINDLGLVSFQRRPGTYVLDIFGLGSLEAARQTDKSSAWLQQIAEKHHADLAMIYPNWFRALPSTWTPLATMCEEPTVGIGRHLSIVRPCMVYYSTVPSASAEIRRQLQAFAPTLPSKETMHFEESTGR